MLRAVMLGLPGAGKGTQARLLSIEFGIPHISTGDIFRGAVQSGGLLGLEARRYIEKGELVPDPIAIQIVVDRLDEPDCRQGFLLDGFPRTVLQAESLDQLLFERDAALGVAINIRVSPGEAIRRIAGRGVCASCQTVWRMDAGDRTCPVCGGRISRRADDDEETAKRRVQVYLTETAQVVEYYRARGLLLECDGEKAVEEVFQELCSRLSGLAGRSRHDNP
ncbi:MAG: adenylate kinase [Firmicutes bacterium]|nr:adenylate kinase [Bacillota bacterium]